MSIINPLSSLRSLQQVSCVVSFAMVFNDQRLHDAPWVERYYERLQASSTVVCTESK